MVKKKETKQNNHKTSGGREGEIIIFKAFENFVHRRCQKLVELYLSRIQRDIRGK